METPDWLTGGDDLQTRKRYMCKSDLLAWGHQRQVGPSRTTMDQSESRVINQEDQAYVNLTTIKQIQRRIGLHTDSAEVCDEVHRFMLQRLPVAVGEPLILHRATIRRGWLCLPIFFFFFLPSRCHLHLDDPFAHRVTRNSSR